MLCLIRHTLEAQFQTDFFINFFLPMKQFNLIFDNRPPLKTICFFIAIIFSFAESGHSQIKFPALQQKQRPETYRIGDVQYRKSDNVVVDIIEMNEKGTGNTPEEVAKHYLENHKTRLGITGDLADNLKHYFTWKGQGSTVVRFQQIYQDIPVDNNEIVIVLNHANRIVSLSNSIRPIKKAIDLIPAISESEAELATMAWFRLIKKPDNALFKQVIHFTTDDTPALCYKVSFMIQQPSPEGWDVFVDARKGSVVDMESNLHHFQSNPAAGTGTGNVFDPDPISTSGADYGSGGFKHDNDANNTDLSGQLMAVTFPIGTQFTGPSYLQGPRAYNQLNPDPCYSNTANWSFNRANDCFEAVMCYYHIDKIMAYYYSFGGPKPQQNQGLSNDGAVRFEAHSTTTPSNPAYYWQPTGTLYFLTFLNDDTNQTVEVAEDAAIIIHELGHGVNDWLTGGNNNISSTQGLGEGFADYWAQSYIRSLGLWKEFEDQYQWASRWFMFTEEVPDVFDRRTDVEIANYPDDIGGLGDGHKQSQVFSTVMMKIYDDIGKFKTDLIALNGMAMTTSASNQAVAAQNIFQAAINAFNIGILTQTDLCIVYEHFKDTYDAAFTSSAPGSSGDYYMRDTPSDFGQEPNDDFSAPIWESQDIWVRKQDDGLTIRELENPEYGQTNYIYVRVRSRGCTSVSDAQLYVYFSKASTALLWPTHWIDYYEQTSNGPVLAGDLVSGAPISLPGDIKAGEERIFKIPWTNIPKPEDFDTEKHHFCLLARIVSQQDPMHTPEVPQLWVNVRDNNNVAWKNLTILEKPPFVGPYTPNGTVFIRQTESTTANTWLRITTPAVGRNVACANQGDLQLRLGAGLHALWQNGGSLGTGIILESDGRLRLSGTDAILEGLALTPGVSYPVEVYYQPDADARGCLLDMAQINYLNQEIGGERFEYNPEKWESSEERTVHHSITGIAQGKAVYIQIYPVPASDRINVQINAGENIAEVFLIVYDSYGRLQLQRSVAVRREGTSVVLEVTALAPGLYFLEIQDNEGHKLNGARFSKF